MAGAILGSGFRSSFMSLRRARAPVRPASFLLESADVAAMAPGTNAGAAHPVLEFGGQARRDHEPEDRERRGGLSALLCHPRNRNAEAAEAAVHSSHSYTAEEALDAAPDRPDRHRTTGSCWLLWMGTPITRMDGNKLDAAPEAGARIVVHQAHHARGTAGLAGQSQYRLLLLVGGALLIYLEFNAPGTIVPGALGTLMVLLAIFGLNLLPIRYTAVMLLVAALVLMLLEAKFGGHGALAIAGIVCLTFGTLTLVAAPVPEMGINPWWLLP
jgi:membrane-bound serine protease (ClpP class)